MRAATKRVSAARVRRGSTGSATRLRRLRVLDAELRVRKGLDPSLLDGLAAPRAEAVRLRLHPAQRGVDLPEEVSDVVLDREILLPLEGGGAGVRRLVVQTHVPGHVRLCCREGTLHDRLELGSEVGALFQEACPEVLDLLRGELGL